MPTMLPSLIANGSKDIISYASASGFTANEILIAIGVVLVTLLLVIGGGGLLALLANAISRFISHNAPSAEVMATFHASYIEQLTVKRNKMEKVNTTAEPADADEEDEDELPTSATPFEVLAKGSRYIALLAAWIAMCGSLFMSEVMGWVPCLLCWYQRVLMYPLTLILAVGLLRKDKGLYKYALVFSIPGACVSLFHYLYQKNHPVQRDGTLHRRGALLLRLSELVRWRRHHSLPRLDCLPHHHVLHGRQPAGKR